MLDTKKQIRYRYSFKFLLTMRGFMVFDILHALLSIGFS